MSSSRSMDGLVVLSKRGRGCVKRGEKERDSILRQNTVGVCVKKHFLRFDE